MNESYLTYLDYICLQQQCVRDIFLKKEFLEFVLIQGLQLTVFGILSVWF